MRRDDDLLRNAVGQLIQQPLKSKSRTHILAEQNGGKAVFVYQVLVEKMRRRLIFSKAQTPSADSGRKAEFMSLKLVEKNRADRLPCIIENVPLALQDGTFLHRVRQRYLHRDILARCGSLQLGSMLVLGKLQEVLIVHAYDIS